MWFMRNHIFCNYWGFFRQITHCVMPEYFKKCGYDTVHIGKWHVGFYSEKTTPLKRGYDKFHGYLTGAENYYSKVECNRNRALGLDFGENVCGLDFHDDNAADNSTFGEYSMKSYVDFAVDYVKKSAQNETSPKIEKSSTSQKPWFMMLALQSVHAPLQAPQQFIKEYSHVKNKLRRIHMAMVTAMDHELGRLFAEIDMDDTIIVFSSDNGGQTLHGGNNWPLRARKGTYFEGGIKVPGFLYPKSLPVDGNRIFHISDWLPSLVDFGRCEIEDSDSVKLDGLNQNLMARKLVGDAPRNLLFNIDELTRSVQYSSDYEKKVSQISGFDVRVLASFRYGDIKLLTGQPSFQHWVSPPENEKPAHGKKPTVPTEEVCRTMDCKKLQNLRIFDLSTDPLEGTNLADNEQLAVKMLQLLAEHNKTAIEVRYPLHDKNAVPIHGVWQPWR